jgi:26S proteasome regulatory subunit N3
MEDVEMKPTEESKQEQAEETKEETPQQTPAAEILTNISFIDRAASTLEPRFTHRVLRSLTSLRKKLDRRVLAEAISLAYPAGVSHSLWSCFTYWYCHRL